MREILFRGKNLITGQWLYGFYHNVLTLESHASNRMVRQDHIYTQDFDIQIEGATLGQYTNMVDKNNLKIFDGDIIKCNYGNEEIVAIVEWIGELAMFHLRKPNTKIYYCGLCSAYNIEVVDNIFDNQKKYIAEV